MVRFLTMHTIAMEHKSADADYITPSPCTTFMVPCSVCGTVSDHFSSGLEDTRVQSGVQIGYQPQSINQLFLFDFLRFLLMPWLKGTH